MIFSVFPSLLPLTRNVKLWVAHAPGMPGTFSQPLRVSDPDMHHGTCKRHVPWCMPGSLTSGGRENVPGIPGACATRSFKGHLHQRGKRADPTPGLHSWSVCRHCVVLFTPRWVRCASAAGALKDRSQSDSSLAEPAGTGSADWSIFIDQWPSAAKWGFRKLELHTDPR